MVHKNPRTDPNLSVGYSGSQTSQCLQLLTPQFGTEGYSSSSLFFPPGCFQILRFIGDKSLRGWQEVLLGNYIAGRGLSDAALRNEIFSQVVAQTWRNTDMEQSQRGWALMATLLSCFGPSPALEKPLLK